MKTVIFLIICLITGIAVHLSANEKIYINREVTTHIVMPENIKMVDISTTKIIGNQCTDNIVRIKPYPGMIPYRLKVTAKTNCWVHSPLSVSVILPSMTFSIPNHPNMLLPSTMYPTMRHSPISIRRFPCRWPRLYDMPGLSMEAEENSTALYQTKTESGHTSTISIPSVTISSGLYAEEQDENCIRH